jgi:3-oxoacyl-[acyl-carrier protein] reductase
MNLELKDKTVFVAGASRGIGFGMARAFAQEGAKVALTGRGEPGLDAARAALAADGIDASRLLTIAAT